MIPRDEVSIYTWAAIFNPVGLNMTLNFIFCGPFLDHVTISSIVKRLYAFSSIYGLMQWPKDEDAWGGP